MKDKKIKNQEKIFNIILFILFFLAILSILLVEPVRKLDELWNYNFARNIADGLIPYKDFNMIVTPFLSFVSALIIKITFNELIVMRIIAALLCSSIMFITYKLFNLLNLKKELSLIFTFLIGVLFKDIFCYDYNYACLLLTLIIIYREIKQYKKDNILIKSNLREDIFLGILAGLAITTKQTCGLFISLALVANKLMFVRTKQEFITYLKSFSYRLIGIIIPVGILIIYLLANNAFYDFISYTILGVTEFSNNMPYNWLFGLNILGILSILVPLTFLYSYIKCILLEKDKFQYILATYGLGIFTVCFPISNKEHFLVGSLPILIVIFYEIYNLIIWFDKKFIKIEKKKVLNILKDKLILSLSLVSIILLLIFGIKNISNYLSMSDKLYQLNHFNFIPKQEGLQEEQQLICDYIQANDKVIILDPVAAAYMIPIDRYKKDYDMFNRGNFGVNGENRIIEQISNSNGIKYLIANEGRDKNWQTPWNIVNYVKENKIKTGSIGTFDIYE